MRLIEEHRPSDLVELRDLAAAAGIIDPPAATEGALPRSGQWDLDPGYRFVHREVERLQQQGRIPPTFGRAGVDDRHEQVLALIRETMPETVTELHQVAAAAGLVREDRAGYLMVQRIAADLQRAGRVGPPPWWFGGPSCLVDAGAAIAVGGATDAETIARHPLSPVTEAVWRQAHLDGWRIIGTGSGGTLALWHTGTSRLMFRIVAIAHNLSPAQADHLTSLQDVGADVAVWRAADWPTIAAELSGPVAARGNEPPKQAPDQGKHHGPVAIELRHTYPMGELS